MIRARFAVADVKAGYVDAIRTRNPKVAHLRYGLVDYKIGYVAGASVRLAVRLAMKGRRS